MGYSLGMLADLIDHTSQQTQAEDNFADLIESAYLAGIIDGQTQELAYLWILGDQQRVH